MQNKKSPMSVLSPFSPLGSASLSSPKRSRYAAACPSTPEGQKTKQVPVDSYERAARRSGKTVATISPGAREDFASQIYTAFRDAFAKLSVTKLEPELLQQAFRSYVDSSAGLLTNDDFDPADLSGLLLSAKLGLPFFIKNPSMKKQINAILPRHVIAKDAQIVDYNDLDRKNLTKKHIRVYCEENLDIKQIWGMGLYGKIGVVDTGFASELANLGEDLDSSLKNAFVLPKYVEKEIRKTTYKHSVQFRSSPSIRQELKQELAKAHVIKYLAGSNSEADFLDMSAQPSPNKDVLQRFPLLKTEIERQLKPFCEKTTAYMVTLVKICISYNSLLPAYSCSAEEINHLYAIHQIIHGSNAAERADFNHEDFLADITSLEGLRDAIMFTRKIDNLSALNAHVSAIREVKSRKNYEDNKVIKSIAIGTFGPLYDVYRSRGRDKIDVKKLFMQFHTYLFELLDPQAYENQSATKEYRKKRDQVLDSLTSNLLKIFKKIDTAVAEVRTPSNSASNSSSSKAADAGAGGGCATRLFPSPDNASSLRSCATQLFSSPDQYISCAVKLFVSPNKNSTRGATQAPGKENKTLAV